MARYPDRYVISTALIVGAATIGFAMPASAAHRHKHAVDHQTAANSSVSYAHRDKYKGYSALVSDGPGTALGFHRNPRGLRVAGRIERARQRDAVHTAVIDSAVGSANPYGYGYYGDGLYGDSVYGFGNNASYGVFSGSDAYGTPYFAGYYGPGDGADLGPLGHAYAD